VHVQREDVAEAPDTGLAREVEEAVEAREVDLVLCQVDAAHVERAGVLGLQLRVVVVVERVVADDLVAGRLQRLREL